MSSTGIIFPLLPRRKHEADLKKFGWLRKYDDSKAFLQERPVLACEETANYLVIQCINLAMEEKFAAMEQVAHQCIAMQYLLELSKQLNIDPRACIAQFFTKYAQRIYSIREHVQMTSVLKGRVEGG